MRTPVAWRGWGATPASRTRHRSLQVADQKCIADLAHSGLAFRLGALLEGKCGELLRMKKAFDWDGALAKPSVTYFGLSATAASEDVELMGRVIAQDAKSACARRLSRL